MPVRIVTDSSCDLTDEEVAKLGIEVVPLSIRFGDEEFVDRTELSVDDFYAKLAASPGAARDRRAGARHVRGGLPPPAAGRRRRRRVHQPQLRAVGHDAVGPERGQGASRASSTCGSSTRARSPPGSAPRCCWPREAAAGGASADEVVALVDDLATRTHVFGALDTLDNLKKGGRIGGAQALLGSLLSIKPIIDISTGKVEEAGKARTRKKALEVLRDKVAERRARSSTLCVHHGLAPDLDEILDLLDPIVPRDADPRRRHRPGDRHPRRPAGDGRHLGRRRLIARRSR